MIDWTDAFENGAYIADAETYPARWDARAQAFRASAKGEIDIAYGEGTRQKMDLFMPAGAPKGLTVFVHGGYWHAFDKSSWSHLAAGAIAHGWAALLPSYTLAPEARISAITAEIAQAIEVAAARVAGPIRLSGHSAGGHLVARMACANTPLARSIQSRIARAVSISGVHDLRPLHLAAMNEVLQLSEGEAAAQSPVLHDPALPFTAWVGAQERPEFLRQTRLIAEAWERKGGDISSHYEPGKHHFDVIDGLADPQSDLMAAMLA